MNNTDNEFILRIQDKGLLIRKRIKKRNMNALEKVNLKELILTQLYHKFKK